MRSIFLTLVVLLSLPAGGCAGQISEMPTWVAFDEDTVEGANDVAVVVLKVVPPAEVLLAAGRIEPSGWRSSGPKNRAWLPARDGFVVARVSPTQDEDAYAIIEVRPGQVVAATEGTAATYDTGFWSAVAGNAAPPSYGPTGEARVSVLKAVAGRVSFVGTLRIAALQEPRAGEAPQKVGITPVVAPEDSDAVKRFMAEHYPKVRARMVSRPLEMMRRNEAAK